MKNYFFKSQLDIRFRSITSGRTVLLPVTDCDDNVVYMNGPKPCSVRMKCKSESLALPPYTLFLTGKNSQVEVDLSSGGCGIALYFDYVGKYCDSKICAFLERNETPMDNTYSILAMNDGLKGYFSCMTESLGALFEENAFCEIKYKEFFYILCQWLSISNFAEFLHPAMSWYDPVFRRKVMDNYQNSYRVKSLASDCGYSEKVFTEKFKAEFGLMPKDWIVNQQKSMILKDLSNNNMSFKQITYEMRMSSVQSFSRFCKVNFGKTPSELRQDLLPDSRT